MCSTVYDVSCQVPSGARGGAGARGKQAQAETPQYLNIKGGGALDPLLCAVVQVRRRIVGGRRLRTTHHPSVLARSATGHPRQESPHSGVPPSLARVVPNPPQLDAGILHTHHAFLPQPPLLPVPPRPSLCLSRTCASIHASVSKLGCAASQDSVSVGSYAVVVVALVALVPLPADSEVTSAEAAP